MVLPVTAAGVGPEVVGPAPQELMAGSCGGIHVGVVSFTAWQGGIDRVATYQDQVAVTVAAEHGEHRSKQKPVVLVIAAGACGRSSHGSLCTGSEDSILEGCASCTGAGRVGCSRPEKHVARE